MKMNPFVLLGAGSSKEAGIPTAVEMTRAMMDSSEPHQNYRFLKVLRFVIGGLKMGQGVQNKDIFQEINIEELFAAIEMLAGKEGLAVAPFVAQWHPAIEEIGQFRLTPWDFELEELWSELKGFIVDDPEQISSDEQRLSEILVSKY